MVMMRKTLLAALVVATAMPAVAQAQTRELWQDRRDIQGAQRDLRMAQRHGDGHEIRDARSDLRHARREYREDWRDYRRDQREVHARGNWRAPFRYHRFNEGVRLRPAYYANRYYIVNPHHYRLPPTRGAHRWVRHYDDVLLVNIRSGRVVRVIHNFFW